MLLPLINLSDDFNCGWPRCIPSCNLISCESQTWAIQLQYTCEKPKASTQCTTWAFRATSTLCGVWTISAKDLVQYLYRTSLSIWSSGNAVAKKLIELCTDFENATWLFLDDGISGLVGGSMSYVATSVCRILARAPGVSSLQCDSTEWIKSDIQQPQWFAILTIFSIQQDITDTWGAPMKGVSC